MLKAERRRRLDSLSRALRQFGLVTGQDLVDTVVGGTVPSVAEVEAAVQLLPAWELCSVPPELVAKSIMVSVLQPVAQTELECLARLEPGQDAAHAYHDLIFAILPQVVPRGLVNPVKEDRQDGGLRRVDITFENRAENGAMELICRRVDHPCPIVPFECKNYTSDIGVPAIDQLVGRLGQDKGRLGIVVCRRIENRERITALCRSALVSNGNYVLVLEDEDLVQAATAGDRLAGVILSHIRRNLSG